MSRSKDDNTATEVEESQVPAMEESPQRAEEEVPYRFVHSQLFPELLSRLRASLLVTTYQAGKLMVLRARDGRLSMLLRSFGRAMGLAVSPSRMALASAYQIWTLYNSPEVAAKLKPAGQYDSCFLPRASHVTGGIDVHEIAWGSGPTGPELWVVNTLFSCLCTLEPEYSFPKPPPLEVRAHPSL